MFNKTERITEQTIKLNQNLTLYEEIESPVKVKSKYIIIDPDDYQITRLPPPKNAQELQRQQVGQVKMALLMD